jgi:hypothetical protein
MEFERPGQLWPRSPPRLKGGRVIGVQDGARDIGRNHKAKPPVGSFPKDSAQYIEKVSREKLLPP